MHGVHGLAGEPQCVHLATRVAGTGRGAAGGAEEEEESSGRGPNGVMTNERGREVSSNTSVDAGAHCVTGRRIVIISSVISSAVYASTGRIMRLFYWKQRSDACIACMRHDRHERCDRDSARPLRLSVCTHKRGKCKSNGSEVLRSAFCGTFHKTAGNNCTRDTPRPELLVGAQRGDSGGG